MSDLVQTRRQFVKTVAVATGYSTLLGRPVTQALAGEIDTQSTSTIGTLRVRISDFPALANASGSIRLGVNPINGTSGPLGSFYPVIINRAPNNVFHALNSRCSHQACVVEAFDGSSCNCFCHGSVFAIDGRRLGGPAGSALTKYTVKFDGTDRLDVTIPGLGYAVTVAPVGASGTRLQLAFRSFRNASYEVQYRETMDKESTAVPFATTPDGELDQTLFTATSAANVNLYVAAQAASGFYTIALKPAEV